MILWTVACQSPLSGRFPRQEYWSGQPFPSSGHLPNLGIESVFSCIGFFTAEPPGKLNKYHHHKEGVDCARFGSTYTKIGTIQRRLAWPLRKDDTQIHEAFHIFPLIYVMFVKFLPNKQLRTFLSA